MSHDFCVRLFTVVVMESEVLVDTRAMSVLLRVANDMLGPRCTRTLALDYAGLCSSLRGTRHNS